MAVCVLGADAINPKDCKVVGGQECRGGFAIIAADDNAGLVQAIETKNITYLTKFPKIGKKTAQQMVLDLEGKVVVASDDLPAKVAVQASAENQELEEAIEAMLALGYKATELKKIKKFFEGTTLRDRKSVV